MGIVHWVIIIIINPLTARVVGAPQMILQTVLSIFPCSPLPSGTCRTPGLSIPCMNILAKEEVIRMALWRSKEVQRRWVWSSQCRLSSFLSYLRHRSSSYIRLWMKISSFQFSPSTDWVVWGTGGTIQQISSSSPFCRRPLRAVLTWAGMCTLWRCPASIDEYK